MITLNTLQKLPNGKYHVIPRTCSFKLNRLPDGSPLKFKAQSCVQSNKKTEVVDYFETFAPVIIYSTVRLSLTLSYQMCGTVKKVDYTNAFDQADPKEQVLVETPRGICFKDGKDEIMKLIKILYGIKQAQQTFFERSGMDFSNEGSFNLK